MDRLEVRLWFQVSLVNTRLALANLLTMPIIVPTHLPFTVAVVSMATHCVLNQKHTTAPRQAQDQVPSGFKEYVHRIQSLEIGGVRVVQVLSRDQRVMFQLPQRCKQQVGHCCHALAEGYRIRRGVGTAFVTQGSWDMRAKLPYRIGNAPLMMGLLVFLTRITKAISY